MSNQTKSTKQLALKLGLVKKRSASSSDQAAKRLRKTFQPYAYLIIIDFESTCWEDKKYRTQEIIEFPAVLLNTGNGEIEEEFHYYVQPRENPRLSEFCRGLTGITQAQVEEGIPIINCLKRFSNWLNKLKQSKGIVFGQPTGSRLDTNLCAFVTWSDWDLGVCLQYECRRKQLLKPAELNCWIDLRATYRIFYARKPEGLNGALKDLGIEFEGREHSGLHDSRNTATLAWRMMCDGCLLNVTKTLPRSVGARMPPMSAGLAKTSNTKDTHSAQSADKPMTILAKPSAAVSTTATTSVSSISVPDTTNLTNLTTTTSVSSLSTCAPRSSTAVSKSIQPVSKTANFTSIRPVTKDNSHHPCQVTKASQTVVKTSVTKAQVSRPIASCQNATKPGSIATNATTSSSKYSVPASNAPIVRIGLTRVSTGKPQTTGQHGITTSAKTSATTVSSTAVTLNNRLTNGAQLSNCHSAVSAHAGNDLKSTSGPNRMSFGASPLLRSDGSQPNKFFRASTATPSNFHKTSAGTTGIMTMISNHLSVNKDNSDSYTRLKTPGNFTNARVNTNNSNTNMSPQDGYSRPSTSKPQTSPDLFKIPTPPAPFRRSSDIQSKPNASFKIPTPPGTGRNSLGNEFSHLSNRTPVTQNTSLNGNITLSDMHRTSPLCECGRRTKRRVVQSPGANQGRAFYGCTLGRGTHSTGDRSKKHKSGCKYFKWESPSLGAGNKSMNNSSFWNQSRNSTMNLSMNSSHIGNCNFNSSNSCNSFNSNTSNHSKNFSILSPAEQFLGRAPCPPTQKSGNSFKSPDLIAMPPADYRSPDLINDSTGSLDDLPLLPPDAFSDPDKT